MKSRSARSYQYSSAAPEFPGSDIDTTFALAFKKLSKKDQATKQRALEQISELFESSSEDTLVQITAEWCAQFRKAPYIHSKVIREKMCRVMQTLFAKGKAVRQQLSTHLNEIIPIWIHLRFDFEGEVRNTVQDLWNSTLSTPAKETTAVTLVAPCFLVAATEALSLSVGTLKELYNLPTEEAEFVLENMVSSSLQGVVFIWECLRSTKQFSIERVTEFLNDGFWDAFNTFSKYIFVRCSFYEVLRSVLQFFPTVVEVKLKEITHHLLVHGLNEKESTILNGLWSPILLLLNKYPACWNHTEGNPHKTFFPRLLAMVRRAFGTFAFEATGRAMLPLLMCVPVPIMAKGAANDIEGVENFTNEFLCTIFHGLTVVQRGGSAVLLDAYFECLSYLCTQIPEKVGDTEGVLQNFFITSHLLPLATWQVFSAASRVPTSTFSKCIRHFLGKLPTQNIYVKLLWDPFFTSALAIAEGNITHYSIHEEDDKEEDEKRPKDRMRKRREANRYVSPVDGTCPVATIATWCERLSILVLDGAIPEAECDSVCSTLVEALLTIDDSAALDLSCSLMQHLRVRREATTQGFVDRIQNAFESSLECGNFTVGATLVAAVEKKLFPVSSIVNLLGTITGKAQEYAQNALSGQVTRESVLLALGKASSVLFKCLGKPADNDEGDLWSGEGMEILRCLVCVLKHDHTSPLKYTLRDDHLETSESAARPMSELPSVWKEIVAALIETGIMDPPSMLEFIEDCMREAVADFELMVPSPKFSHETLIRVLDTMHGGLQVAKAAEESSSSVPSEPVWAGLLCDFWEPLLGGVLNTLVRRKMKGTSFDEFNDWLDVHDSSISESAPVFRLVAYATFVLDCTLKPKISDLLTSSDLRHILFRMFSIQALSNFITPSLPSGKLSELLNTFGKSLGFIMEGEGALSTIQSLLVFDPPIEHGAGFHKPLNQVTRYSILHFAFTTFHSISVAHIGLSLLETKNFDHLQDYILGALISRSTHTRVTEHALVFIGDTLTNLVKRIGDTSTGALTHENISLLETLCNLVVAHLEQRPDVLRALCECTDSLISILKTNLPSTFDVKSSEEETKEVLPVQSPTSSDKPKGLLSWFSWRKAPEASPVPTAPQLAQPAPAPLKRPHFSELLANNCDLAVRFCGVLHTLAVSLPAVHKDTPLLLASLVECAAAAVSAILAGGAPERTTLPLTFIPCVSKCLSLAQRKEEPYTPSPSSKFLFGVVMAVLADYSRIFIDVLCGKPLPPALNMKELYRVLDFCLRLEIPVTVWLEVDLQFGSVAAQFVRVTRDLHVQSMKSFSQGFEDRFAADSSITPSWLGGGPSGDSSNSIQCSLAGRLVGKFNSLVRLSLSVRANRVKLVNAICADLGDEESSSNPTLLEAAMLKKIKQATSDSEELNEDNKESPEADDDDAAVAPPSAVPDALRRVLECPPPLSPSLYTLLRRQGATPVRLRKLTVNYLRKLLDTIETSAICRVLALTFSASLGWLIDAKIEESVVLPWLRSSNTIFLSLDVMFAVLFSQSGLESTVGAAAIVKGTFLDMSIASKVRAALQLHASIPETGISPESLAGVVLPCLRKVVMHYPSITRMWWSQGDNNCTDIFENFVMHMVSPELIESQLSTLQKNFAAFKEEQGDTSEYIDQEAGGMSPAQLRQFLSDEEVSVTVNHETKSVNISFEKDGNVVALRIRIPSSYPLRQVAFEDDAGESGRKTRGGINYDKWRKWTLQMTRLLFAQNSTLWQCVVLWCSNLARMFSGVEPCPICYSVVSQANQRLPELKCKTCSNSFHSSCLLKWFKSSGNNTCPLCRTPWF